MVYQESDNTCGNSCVRNILNIVFKKDKYNTYYIKENLDTFTKIKDELFKNGLSYQGYKTNNLSYINNKKLPAIIQVYNGTKFHFVVLYSLGRKYAKIIDPQFGKIIIPVEELKFIFTGKILLLEDKIDSENINNNIQFINIRTSLQYIILSIIQLISTYLLFNNLSSNTNINYVLLLGFISFASIVLHNVLNFNTRNKLNKILDIYSNDSNSKEDIISLSKVLDNEVVIISSSLNYFVTILICVFLLCNSFYDSIIPLLSITTFAFKSILTPFINNTKREISYFEDIAFSHLETDKVQFSSFMKKAKKRSFTFLLFSLLPYLILFLLNLLYSYISFIINPSFNISKFIFTLFISFFIYSLLDKLIQSLNKKDISYKELNKMTLSIKSISLKKKTIIYYNNNEE